MSEGDAVSLARFLVRNMALFSILIGALLMILGARKLAMRILAMGLFLAFVFSLVGPGWLP